MRRTDIKEGTTQMESEANHQCWIAIWIPLNPVYHGVQYDLNKMDPQNA